MTFEYPPVAQIPLSSPATPVGTVRSVPAGVSLSSSFPLTPLR